jgi:hypothetical protein
MVDDSPFILYCEISCKQFFQKVRKRQGLTKPTLQNSDPSLDAEEKLAYMLQALLVPIKVRRDARKSGGRDFQYRSVGMRYYWKRDKFASGHITTVNESSFRHIDITYHYSTSILALKPNSHQQPSSHRP